MQIEYLNDMNLSILYPECFKTKTLTPELKKILLKDIMEELEYEREESESDN